MTTTRATAQAPGAWPLAGHAWPLFRDPLRFLTSLPAHGTVVWIRIGPFRAAVVCDPSLTRQVLLDDHTFDKGGLLVERGKEVVGNGVGTCPHSEHHRQRRLTQPGFHPSRFPRYAQVMTEQITHVTGAWRDGQTIDVLGEMLTITARNVVDTMFSATAVSTKTLGEILDDFAAVLPGIYRRMFLPPPLDRVPTPGNRRYNRARDRLRRTVRGIIADYRSAGIDHGDVLSMLTAPDRAAEPGDEPGGLSDTEVIDQIVTLFLAGTESTASILAWALHVLGQRPDLEGRLHAEVDSVLAGTPPAYDDVPALKLTANIITETLRVYPPGWLFTRKATLDTELDGHRIPAETTVIYSPYLLHHRPDLFTDPERFDPDRWASASTPAPARSIFVPFGAGPRKCLGDNFAVTEATLALATIAARWRLEPIAGTRVRRTVDTTLRPRGLRMRVTARVPADRAAPVPEAASGEGR
jgi:pentalenene oxygenase